MRASANRTQDNESRAVANNVSCKREERQAVHIVDNSPHTKRIAQFQAMMDKSMNPHQVQLRKFREMIDNSPQRKKIVLPGVTQKKGPLDEDELQFKSKEAVQKKGPLDEDELQFKKDETVQCKGPLDEEELQFKAEEPVQKQENRTGLPDELKAGVENLSGMAMDDVRVHYNSGKPAQLNAYAYTQGTEIHVAPGQEKHLPHEAWHVVQQKQGRVQPTVQMAGGVAVNDDKGLEREADVMGIKAKTIETNTTSAGEEISGREGAQEVKQRAPAQRMTQDKPEAVFSNGAIVDCTTTLVIRGDRIFTPSNEGLESYISNAGKKQVGKKGAVTWLAGTTTGQSVMSNTTAIPNGKKISVVKSIPNSLKIVQCNNNNHAELHTNENMSNTQIEKALNTVKLTGIYDANIAQLRSR